MAKISSALMNEDAALSSCLLSKLCRKTSNAVLATENGHLEMSD